MERKRLPTELKLVQGTYRAREARKREARPQRARPTPPAHLGEVEKTKWKRMSDELFGLGLLTRIDRAALAAYCKAYERWVAAELARASTSDPVTQYERAVTSGSVVAGPDERNACKRHLDDLVTAPARGLA